MTFPERSRLNDYCAKGLLRRYSETSITDGRFQRPSLSSKDIEELCIRWALSGRVGRLAMHMVDFPREIRSSLEYMETKTSGEITGAIDARATMWEQATTADPSIFVVVESSPSYANGPNHLIGWILREAEDAVLALLHRAKGIAELAWVHERARLLDAALRNQTLRAIATSPLGKQRPSLSTLRTAARSRATVYRLALDAYEAYEGIERLDVELLKSILGDTLLAPLEDWQMLELSAALAIADSLAEACSAEPEILLRIGQSRIVARAGPFLVMWQRSLPSRQNEDLDPSEIIAKEIALSIGSDTASSRVDVCVVHADTGVELAHVECKWFINEQSVSSAVSDAAMQITRYARDSRPQSVAEARRMLEDSLVVVAMRGQYSERTNCLGPVGFTDFDGLEGGALKSWARTFVSRHRQII